MAEQEEPILCAKDRVPLVTGNVEITYQGHFFPVDLLRCPICGEVFVPEELASGHMLEVEQTLEEK